MTNPLNALVGRLRGLGITVAAQGDSLLCSDPASRLTPQLRAEIRSARPQLMAMLQNRRPGGVSLLEVPATSGRARYPASSQQRRLYALQQLDPDGVAYNVTAVYRLPANVDLARVQQAVDRVLARHETLRSSLEIDGDALAQRIDEAASCRVESERISRVELEAKVADFVRPFDLAGAPLLRVKLLAMDGEVAMVTDLHHAIADGASTALLARDFRESFEGIARPPPARQYGDYAVWQQEGAGRALIERQAAYWKNQYAEPLEALALPTDCPRPRSRDFAGAAFTVEWDAELTASLRQLCRERDATLFAALFALFSAALARLSGQADLAIGTVVSGRESDSLADTIGMFANTLALRARPAGDKSFASFLAECRESCIGAFQNQQYPFEELLADLDLARDASRNPLFDAFLVLQNFESPGEAEAGVAPYPIERRTAKFDLSLNVRETGKGLQLEFEYATALFGEPTARRIAQRLERMARAAVANPEAKLAELPVLLPGERERLLLERNATRREYPRDRSIHSFFEEQAAKTPGATALIFGDQTLSYADVEQRANRLARRLADAFGIGRGDIVALALERSFEMVIAVLAALKTGAAYAPIDPQLPGARLDYILSNSGAKVLLTQRRLGVAPGCPVAVVDLEDPENWPSDATPLESEAAGDDLLYAIYTSGSTGKPKGVLIEHRVAVNCLLDTERMYPLGNDGRYLLKTTYSFDVSISELFGWFLGGGALVILPPEEEREPSAILRTIAEHGVTHVNFVPSMLMALLESLEPRELEGLAGLKRIILAGEAVSPALLERLATVRGAARVENVYGPSETFYTTWQSLTDWQPGQRVPIGRPFSNVRIYVLDTKGELLPEGTRGEICVSGDSLARGYLGLDELTGARFVANPFEPGQRMYRTGDLGRWLPDGSLEYLGRMDGQVKIRGNRVELGEVEGAILAAGQPIREVAVEARQRGGALALVAYCETDAELDLAALRARLQGTLPAYMLPSYFVSLSRFPRSSSGKIDRKALPMPTEQAPTGRELVAPKNATERALAQVWSEVLKVPVETLSVLDNFFELGGDSLLAIKVAGKARMVGLQVTVRQVMDRQTIEALAELPLQRSGEEAASDAPAAEDESEVPLTYYQRGMLYEGAAARTFVIALRFHVRQRLDAGAARNAISALVSHHEGLRARFCNEDGAWRCRVMPFEAVEADSLFEYRDLSASDSETQAAAIESDWETDRKTIDVIECRNAKMVLYDLGPDKPQRLHFFVSHAVCDGVGVGVLLGDLVQLYGQLARGERPSLPPQVPSLRQLSQAFVDICEAPDALDELPYWEGLPWDQIRPIPFDFDVGEEANTFCSHIYTEAYLEERYTRALLDELPKRGATMLDALLLAWMDSVCPWTGGDVAHVNLIDGRGLLSRFASELDYARSVGWLASGRMHVLSRPTAERASDRLQQIVGATRAMPHGGLGYDRLWFSENEKARRALAHTQGVQKLLLNYFSIGDGKDDQPKLLDSIQVGEGERVHLKSLKDRHDSLLHVPVILMGGRLRVSTDYSENLFRHATIRAFFGRFLDSLRGLAEELRGAPFR